MSLASHIFLTALFACERSCHVLSGLVCMCLYPDLYGDTAASCHMPLELFATWRRCTKWFQITCKGYASRQQHVRPRYVHHGDAEVMSWITLT